MKILLQVVSLLWVCQSVTQALTSSNAADIERKLRALVKGSVIPTAVRLAFHDCVGGCDGCLNTDNPDNAGLSDIVAELDTIYQDNGYSELMSRADFWAFTGYYSLNLAAENANTTCNGCMPELGLVFKTGRVDCSTSPNTDVDVGLPSAHLDYTGLINYFRQEFGFSADETVALMGVHTLGSASRSASGFNGVWVQGGSRDLNNDYYKIMVNSENNWRQKDVSRDTTSPAIQWNARRVGFMLNSDMAIYKDFLLDEDGNSSCTYDDCPASASAELVEKYAASNEDWIPAFAAVFTKMVEHVDVALENII